MARAVFDRLSAEDRTLFTGGKQPEGAPIGVIALSETNDTNSDEQSASSKGGGDAGHEDANETSDEDTPAKRSLEKPFTFADDPLRMKEHLDRSERWLRSIIKGWREDGWNQAADNLERYLAGSGEPLRLDRDQARSFEQIRDLEQLSRSRFEQQSFLARANRNKEFNDALRGIKDGEEIVLPPERWDSGYGGLDSAIDVVSGNGGFYEAFGRTHIRSSTVDMTARREGDTIHLSGTVVHHWMDPYDFDKDQSYTGPSLRMEEHRGAKPFGVVATWRQHVEGAVRINNGGLEPDKKRPFKWTDVDR